MMVKPFWAMTFAFMMLMSLSGTLSGLAAREQIPAETREYGFSAQLPACDAPHILGRIQGRFANTEAGFWNNRIAIEAVTQIRTIAFRPDGLDLIPRRYCQATAILSDRSQRRLRYAIIEDYGIIGMTTDVHFCVEGFDRNFTTSPACGRFNR